MLTIASRAASVGMFLNMWASQDFPVGWMTG
jgi:hypothetical protein